ncbi:MAG: homoserine dehydrogenase [Tepidisphaeraceae bacterium]
MAQSVGITLLGAGVVGRGVLRILQAQGDLLRSRTGLVPVVRHVVCRDPARHADLNSEFGDSFTVGTDARAAIHDPQVQIVVELAGGIDHAGTYVAEALSAAKHVVTANKALLAHRGPELFQLAKKNKVSIGFEASCGGGIPIIDALTRGLIGNRIDTLIGIVNGTCNFILTQMSKNGQAYADALKDAQKQGFAEADPTMDVSGRDSAQKLSILATLAFNQQITEQHVRVSGIDTLQSEDIRLADKLGYAIKLLAIAQREGESVSLSVQPTLVHKGDLFADVSGSFNAIAVYGSAIGHQFFYGRGAGQMPTASAVVADILGVALGTIPHAFERLNVFPGTLPSARILPVTHAQSRFYLRVTAANEPGVFAQITQTLGRHNISLAGVFQQEADDEAEFVPVVVTTHTATVGEMQSAVREIEKLPSVQPGTVCLSILEQPEEFA